ncbi:ubiquitin-like domain-containing protein [Streptomyces sp. NPDC059785]|uniref:ubiquitin-like domain-containing protein n=1 Tax=Streptomyces sp. NPDC059785 TaxID=3346945 RepID=UPI003669F18F
MSNTQYETYGPVGPYAPALHEPPAPYPPYDLYGTYDAAGRYVTPAPPYEAYEAYGVHGGYADTYRPAYEEALYEGPEDTEGFKEGVGPEEAGEPGKPGEAGDAGDRDGARRSGGRAEARKAEARKAEARKAEVRKAGARRTETRRAEARRAEARGAGRRRRAASRPEPLRRLLPQALVVAFLAGGTSAFVAEDKAVELNVDGEPRTLHTFADDVSGLLTEEGVDVGGHDLVAPGPGTELTSGDAIAVRYGRPVRLTLDGQRRRMWTTARTVDEVLHQLGVRPQGAYVSAARSRPIGRAGMTLEVRTERTVTIMADGRARTIRTNAATVRETVAQAGITLHGQDTTSVPPGSFPRDGQTVTVLRITGTREIREEPIRFETRRTQDPELFQGTEVVERAGRPGARRVTYALRTVNGVRQKPRRLKTEVVREPRTQVIKVGTKPLPDSVAGADDLNWPALAQCESGGRPGAVDSSGTYGGLYQFDTNTWHGLGGFGRPQDASAEEQTFRAKKLYVRQGTAPWPHCGSRLEG